MSNKPPLRIHRIVTERVTIDLDQDELELAIAQWLMDRHAGVFGGVSFNFDWSDNRPDDAICHVYGERIVRDV